MKGDVTGRVMGIADSVEIRCEAMSAAAGCAAGDFNAQLVYANGLARWVLTGLSPAEATRVYEALTGDCRLDRTAP
jgi:hypothetical protein